MRMAVYDIESSSAITDWSSILEIGGILIDENFKEIDTTKDEEKISKGIKDKDQRLQSDDILKIVEKDFQDLNFKIETDKKKSNKIKMGN